MTNRRLLTVARCSIALALLTALAPSARVDAAGGEWTIVDTLPVPEGASGLAWDGTWLYCGIYGADGGRIYRIDPITGGHTLLFTGVHDDAFGLTYDGTHLWTTDHPGSSSTPATALKLDWDGTVLDSIDLPAHYMSGIAYDTGDFWVARYYPDPSHLFKMSAAGATLDDFVAPDNQPWDLCMHDGDLWMADYWGDTIYRIDAATGTLLESHPTEGVDPAGVVWDGTHLWYCDNGMGFDIDFLYKVDLSGGGTPAISVPVTAHDFGQVTIGEMATWNVTVQNTGSAPLEISGVTFAPPADLSSSAAFPVTIRSSPGSSSTSPVTPSMRARPSTSTPPRPTTAWCVSTPTRAGSRRSATTETRRSSWTPSPSTTATSTSTPASACPSASARSSRWTSVCGSAPTPPPRSARSSTSTATTRRTIRCRSS
jgi:hypothetical protein